MEQIKFSVVEKFHLIRPVCDEPALIKGLKGDKMKSMVEPIRKLLSEGEKEKADKLKQQLPAIMISGIFKGGRTADKLEEYSHIICLDLDHLPLEKLAPIKDVITLCEYTLAVFISPSGRGLKILVKISSGSNYHKDAYRQVLAFYTKLTGQKFDEKTCDINRLTFMSYDPEIYHYPDSVVFQVMTPIKANTLTVKSETTTVSNWDNHYSVAHRLTSKKQQYSPHNRNNFIHLLASNANRFGIPKDVFLSKLDWCDKPIEEINSTVGSAYKRTEDFGKWNLDEENIEVDETNNNQCDPDVEPKLEEKDVEVNTGEDPPYFPKEIFNSLPKLLKDLCSAYIDDRDKDLVLLSSIGILSSLFPTVKGHFDGDEIGPNIYVFISAPAASGKGVINKTRKLGTNIQTQLKERYLREAQEFRTGNKRDAENEDSDLPIPPVKKSLFIPANTSVSKIIEMIGCNEKFGVIFESEGDTLANALKNDWGDFSDILRKAFHHETISMARRGDNEHIEIESPHLSVVLSGTPNQVENVIESVENGFFSRFFFYDFECDPIWKDQFMHEGNCLKKIFDEASNYLGEVWSKHEGNNNTLIQFNPNHQQQLNNYFKTKLAELYGEWGSDIVPSIKRTCLICYRLAMVLATLRALETNDVLPEKLYIEEADYKIALSLVDTGLVHLVRVFNRFKRISVADKLNNQQRIVFEAIPKEYTRKEYDQITTDLGIKSATADKYLSDFKKKNLIFSPKHGNYQKVA